MVSHDHMHHVVGSALWHVTAAAIGALNMLPISQRSRGGRLEHSCMATFANAVVVRCRGRPARNIARIMTGCASKPCGGAPSADARLFSIKPNLPPPLV